MNRQKKIAQLIIARLDGKDINKKFKYYESLVKKGIGGFIVFGGRLKEVRNGIKNLQAKAEIPLFIASDLEQGLGQQIEGGTFFPPAMAIAKAVNPKNKRDIKLLRKSINIIAQEAKALGISVIFSPVLDVNTNPKNPIICTRAFSDDPKEVAWFGKEFINGFQKQGIIACAKHFPGHGDTTKDSHLSLPVINAGMDRLRRVELYPFKMAVKAGVKMIMVGHLKVPAIDSKLTSSLSQKTMQSLLREKMKFKGLVMTDAMNMRAVSGGGHKSESKACLTALNAGANMLLHPSKPEETIDYLFSRWNEIRPSVEGSFQKVIKAKKALNTEHRIQNTNYRIGAKSHWKTANELTRKSIKIKNKLKKFKESPVVLIIDDNCKSGNVFVKTIKDYYPKIKTCYIDNKYQGSKKAVLSAITDKILIAGVFSKISAWKGRSGLNRELKTILQQAVKTSRYSVIAGFCCPYVLRELTADSVIEAYSDSELAQEAVAEILCGP